MLNLLCSPLKMRKFMSHIEVFKAQLPGWEIVHISRNCNDIVDALANSDLTRQVDLVVFYE